MGNQNTHPCREQQHEHGEEEQPRVSCRCTGEEEQHHRGPGEPDARDHPRGAPALFQLIVQLSAQASRVRRYSAGHQRRIHPAEARGVIATVVARREMRLEHGDRTRRQRSPPPHLERDLECAATGLVPPLGRIERVESLAHTPWGRRDGKTFIAPCRKLRERSAPQERSTVLPRRRPHHVAEGAAQVGLIGESEIGRDLGQGFAASEGVARPLHA